MDVASRTVGTLLHLASFSSVLKFICFNHSSCRFDELGNQKNLSIEKTWVTSPSDKVQLIDWWANLIQQSSSLKHNGSSQCRIIWSAKSVSVYDWYFVDSWFEDGWTSPNCSYRNSNHFSLSEWLVDLLYFNQTMLWIMKQVHHLKYFSLESLCTNHLESQRLKRSQNDIISGRWNDALSGLFFIRLVVLYLSNPFMQAFSLRMSTLLNPCGIGFLVLSFSP